MASHTVTEEPKLIVFISRELVAERLSSVCSTGEK